MNNSLTVGDLRKQLEGLPASMPIVLSIDDEGNGYRKAYVGTDVGYFLDGEFVSVEELKHLKADKEFKDKHPVVYQSMLDSHERVIAANETAFCIQ